MQTLIYTVVLLYLLVSFSGAKRIVEVLKVPLVATDGVMGYTDT